MPWDRDLEAGSGALVQRLVSGEVDSERHEQGKQQLLTLLQAQRPSPRRWSHWLLFAAALSLPLSGSYLWVKRARAPLTYSVEGEASPQVGSYLRAQAPEGARLAFSDGSLVALADGTRARVAAVDHQGARVTVEAGQLALSVARQSTAAWFVDAGPFVIRVTGAELEISWSTSDESLRVDLRHGSAVVHGPNMPGGVPLLAGQRLSAREGALSIEELPAR